MKRRYLHRIMYLQCLSFFHLIFWPSPMHEVITGCWGGWRGYGGCWLHDPPLAGLGPAEDGPRPRHRCEASARPGSWQQPPSWSPASDPWCGPASHNLARTRHGQDGTAAHLAPDPLGLLILCLRWALRSGSCGWRISICWSFNQTYESKLD